jgi:hypothetical protein
MLMLIKVGSNDSLNLILVGYPNPLPCMDAFHQLAETIFVLQLLLNVTEHRRRRVEYCSWNKVYRDLADDRTTVTTTALPCWGDWVRAGRVLVLRIITVRIGVVRFIVNKARVFVDLGGIGKNRLLVVTP